MTGSRCQGRQWGPAVSRHHFHPSLEMAITKAKLWRLCVNLTCSFTEHTPSSASLGGLCWMQERDKTPPWAARLHRAEREGRPSRKRRRGEKLRPWVGAARRLRAKVSLRRKLRVEQPRAEGTFQREQQQPRERVRKRDCDHPRPLRLAHPPSPVLCCRNSGEHREDGTGRGCRAGRRGGDGGKVVATAFVA